MPPQLYRGPGGSFRFRCGSRFLVPGYTRIGVVALIASIVLKVGGTSALGQQPGSASIPQPYVIHGLEIELQVPAQGNARDQAIQQSQRQAFAILWQRLAPARSPAPMPEDRTIRRLVQGFNILGEQSSSRRYRASFSIMFHPERVRSFFDDQRVAALRPPLQPYVVLPLYQNENGILAFWTDWYQFWLQEQTLSDILPILIPHPAPAESANIQPQDVMDEAEMSIIRVGGLYQGELVVVALFAQGAEISESSGRAGTAAESDVDSSVAAPLDEVSDLLSSNDPQPSNPPLSDPSPGNPMVGGRSGDDAAETGYRSSRGSPVSDAAISSSPTSSELQPRPNPLVEVRVYRKGTRIWQASTILSSSRADSHQLVLREAMLWVIEQMELQFRAANELRRYSVVLRFSDSQQWGQLYRSITHPQSAIRWFDVISFGPKMAHLTVYARVGSWPSCQEQDMKMRPGLILVPLPDDDDVEGIVARFGYPPPEWDMTSCPPR